jgi:hypothetical protein
MRCSLLCNEMNTSPNINVSDPHHIDADPDPAFHFYADPDPDADPDPAIQNDADSEHWLI